MNKCKQKTAKFNPAGLILLLLLRAGMILFSRLETYPRLTEGDYQVLEQEITPNADPSKLVVSEKGIALTRMRDFSEIFA